jgi:hypothetical protein
MSQHQFGGKQFSSMEFVDENNRGESETSATQQDHLSEDSLVSETLKVLKMPGSFLDDEGTSLDDGQVQCEESQHTQLADIGESKDKERSEATQLTQMPGVETPAAPATEFEFEWYRLYTYIMVLRKSYRAVIDKDEVDYRNKPCCERRLTSLCNSLKS